MTRESRREDGARILCHEKRHLSVGSCLLKCHLRIFCGAKGDKVAILIPVFYTKGTIVAATATERNLLPYFVDEIVVLRLPGHLDDEDVLTKVHLDLDRGELRLLVMHHDVLERLRTRRAQPKGSKG